MDHFSTFLQNLRQKINKGELERTKIANSISVHLGIEIPASAISIKNNTVHVKVSSTIKQELSYKKEEILEDLKKQGVTVKSIL